MYDADRGDPRTDDTEGLTISRREVLLAGGAALVSLSVRGTALAGLPGPQATFPGVSVVSGAKKPVYVPAAGSTDPVAHSLADSLFWLDQETEHAKLFVMHMPSPDLDPQRRQAMQFQDQLSSQLQKVQRGRLDRGTLADTNRSTGELVRRFLDFKHTAQRMQESGQLKSLAWPTFFEHVALEGERFAKRLDQFSAGNVGLERGEVLDFWSRIMADHADFVAHLLDPAEKALIQKAMDAATQWRAAKGMDAAKVDGTLDEFIAFKKTAQAGVEGGKIKSIIHPILADHVLREALKFSDELKRVS
jgi:hypothetical protein